MREDDRFEKIPNRVLGKGYRITSLASHW